MKTGRDSVLMSLSLLLGGCQGNSVTQPVRAAQGALLFSEDFERDDYASRWRLHWDPAVGAGLVDAPPQYVYAGRRATFLLNRAGHHGSDGNGEYVPEQPMGEAAYMRLYLRLEDGFSMGGANQLKLFGIYGGAGMRDTYAGAGKRPRGDDKFSARLSLDRHNDLHVYTYYPDQRDRWGDWLYCTGLFCGARIEPGRWHCLEIGVKLNTPGRHDGELWVWHDGEAAIVYRDLRYRDTPDVLVRRFAVEAYFGGSGARNTSPQDQRIYVDELAIGAQRIGCR